ncbi:MAG: hypothetical protein ACOYON_09250 [Fimbriimonas sp.]
MVFSIGVFGVMISGCGQSSGAAKSTPEASASASFSAGPDGVKFTAKDDKGAKADVEVGSAKVDIKDGEGGGFSFDMDSKTGTFKMKAGDKDSKFENDVSISESELGVPIYPGSSEVRVASMRAESTKERSVISVRTTTDSPEQVADFYRSKMTVNSESKQKDDTSTEIELKEDEKSGRKFAVSAKREDGKTTTVTVVRVTPK